MAHGPLSVTGLLIHLDVELSHRAEKKPALTELTKPKAESLH